MVRSTLISAPVCDLQSNSVMRQPQSLKGLWATLAMRSNGSAGTAIAMLRGFTPDAGVAFLGSATPNMRLSEGGVCFAGGITVRNTGRPEGTNWYTNALSHVDTEKTETLHPERSVHTDANWCVRPLDARSAPPPERARAERSRLRQV